jgi:hypothetical protein
LEEVLALAAELESRAKPPDNEICYCLKCSPAMWPKGNKVGWVCDGRKLSVAGQISAAENDLMGSFRTGEETLIDWANRLRAKCPGCFDKTFWAYFGDSSGNNDSHFECKLCGACFSKEHEIR